MTIEGYFADSLQILWTIGLFLSLIGFAICNKVDWAQVAVAAARAAGNAGVSN